MSPSQQLTVYCDERSDELLAQKWLKQRDQQLDVRRLPTLPKAPDFLRPLLTWERLDWVVCAADEVRCAVELSRHGYTGDNSFQRFARIFRAATLGIPVIYFTPFSRARLNELDEGQSRPRNVAPELFATMQELSESEQVPCLCLDWPTSANGIAVPLGNPLAEPRLQQLADLVFFLSTNRTGGSNTSLPSQFSSVLEPMRRQAALPYRGSETRGPIRLPIDPTSTTWIWDWLPADYFSKGKVDKILAAHALRQVPTREVVRRDTPTSAPWPDDGLAWALFLGYQDRPDPACGLIGLAAAQARARGMPLVVIWPRLFLDGDGVPNRLLAALREFARSGQGPLADEARRCGFSEDAVLSFRQRVSTSRRQFGTYRAKTKVGRILQETASLLVLGNATIRW